MYLPQAVARSLCGQVAHLIHADVRDHVPAQGPVQRYRQGDVFLYRLHGCRGVFRQVLLLPLETPACAVEAGYVPVMEIIIGIHPLKVQLLPFLRMEILKVQGLQGPQPDAPYGIVQQRDGSHVDGAVPMDGQPVEQSRDCLHAAPAAHRRPVPVPMLQAQLGPRGPHEGPRSGIYVNIRHGIPGDAYDCRFLLMGVQRQQEDGVRLSAVHPVLYRLYFPHPVYPEEKEGQDILVVAVMYPFIAHIPRLPVLFPFVSFRAPAQAYRHVRQPYHQLIAAGAPV